MILLVRPTPWYRDLGVLASVGFASFVLVFNLFADTVGEQVTGTLAAAPMLAAVLVERAERVFIATAYALGVAVVGMQSNDLEWDYPQYVRLALIAGSGAVGFTAARVRLADRSQLVGIREVARTAQRAIMAMSPPTHEGIQSAVRYASATEHANIGGDAYEAAETPFGLRMLVSDAMGKGLPSIRTSTIAIGAFREWAHVQADLSDLLLRMDASVGREVGLQNFVTAIVAELRGRRLRFSSAGHPMPLLVREGRVRLLGLRPSPPLSLTTAAGVPEVGEIELRAGDLVVMYTDGLSEARAHDGRYFPLSEVLSRIGEQSAAVEETADALIAELREFVQSDLDDDVALVMLRVCPSG